MTDRHEPGAASSDETARLREARRVRREWIVNHHPDRGGDPALFKAGLRRLDEAAGFGPAGPHPPRVTVRRSKSPLRRVRTLIRTLRRKAAGLPPRRVQ